LGYALEEGFTLKHKTNDFIRRTDVSRPRNRKLFVLDSNGKIVLEKARIEKMYIGIMENSDIMLSKDNFSFLDLMIFEVNDTYHLIEFSNAHSIGKKKINKIEFINLLNGQVDDIKRIMAGSSMDEEELENLFNSASVNFDQTDQLVELFSLRNESFDRIRNIKNRMVEFDFYNIELRKETDAKEYSHIIIPDNSLAILNIKGTQEEMGEKYILDLPQS